MVTYQQHWNADRNEKIEKALMRGQSNGTIARALGLTIGVVAGVRTRWNRRLARQARDKATRDGSANVPQC